MKESERRIRYRNLNPVGVYRNAARCSEPAGSRSTSLPFAMSRYASWTIQRRFAESLALREPEDEVMVASLIPGAPTSGSPSTTLLALVAVQNALHGSARRCTAHVPASQGNRGRSIEACRAQRIAPFPHRGAITVEVQRQTERRPRVEVTAILREEREREQA